MEELGALEQKKQQQKTTKQNKKQKTIDYQAKSSFFVGECRSSLITPSKINVHVQCKSSNFHCLILQ